MTALKSLTYFVYVYTKGVSGVELQHDTKADPQTMVNKNGLQTDMAVNLSDCRGEACVCVSRGGSCLTTQL